ncbi:hypothetical protein GGI43DRAFT_206743 [Trichoderma evansii]
MAKEKSFQHKIRSAWGMSFAVEISTDALSAAPLRRVFYLLGVRFLSILHIVFSICIILCNSCMHAPSRYCFLRMAASAAFEESTLYNTHMSCIMLSTYIHVIFERACGLRLRLPGMGFEPPLSLLSQGLAHFARYPFSSSLFDIDDKMDPPPQIFLGLKTITPLFKPRRLCTVVRRAVPYLKREKRCSS